MTSNHATIFNSATQPSAALSELDSSLSHKQTKEESNVYKKFYKINFSFVLKNTCPYSHFLVFIGKVLISSNFSLSL